jgi:hypothetical membrane protein
VTDVSIPAPVRLTARIGTAAWIVGAVQFLVANAVAQAARTTPYSLVHNNISDLGVVSCGVFDEEFPRYICSPLHDPDHRPGGPDGNVDA